MKQIRKNNKSSDESFEIEEWDHSPLGPSASERWLECPGSVLLTKDMGDTSSEYAIEGTAAHTVTEWARNEGMPGSHYLGRIVNVKLGQKGKNGEDLFQKVEVDQAMADATDFFVEYVDQFEGDIFVEERLSYTAWVENGFGTSDDIRIGEKRCVVTDFKYGKGIQVFAENNSQLKLYALGVFHDLGYMYDIEEFQLNICQPRLNHIDEWTISTVELLKWAEEVVRPGAEAATKAGATFKAGNWCQFCLAKHTCKTRAKSEFEKSVGDFEDLDENTLVEPRDTNVLSLAEIGLLLPFISAGKAFWEDLEKHALSEVAKGHIISHPDTGDYKLVAGRSNRIWKNVANDGETKDEAIERKLRQNKLKVADIFTKKLKGPAAIESILGKKHPLMLELVEKPPGKPKLVPGNDKRPALEVKAEEEFDDLDNDEE